MAYKVFFSPMAEDDLEGICDYYFERNPKIAGKLYTGILSQIETLVKFPKRGRIVPEFFEESILNYREVISENFRVIYRQNDKKILIIRIIDARRLLNYGILRTC